MGGSSRDWFTTAETTSGGGEPTIADDIAATDEVAAFPAAAVAPEPAPPPVLAAGEYLGRYLLDVKLGEGGMGQVWRARDPQLDRAVAIKVVHPAIARSPDGAARLLREARAMAKLSHRNVVAVFDAGDDRGQLFVAMELVDGLTLGDLLRGRDPGRPRDWRRALALYGEAGRGLAAAHSAGVLHRDFKPDNVMVDREGRVCVGDFGLAAFGGARERRASPSAPVGELTATGAVVGTPAFMSPEQLRGDPIDERSDQYSFAVALYEALYGEHPFGADTAPTIRALLERIERGEVRPPPRGDEVPRWLRAAVMRGLAADPAARWPGLGAFLAAIGRRVPRVPWLLVGATALAVLAAALAAIVVVRAGRDGPRPAAAAIRHFDVSMATRIALSPDGRRLAMATGERLDVRELATGRVWTHLEPGTTRIDRVQFDGNDRVLFARPHPLRLASFALDGGAVSELWSDDAWHTWLGRLTAGEVVARTLDSGGWEIGLIASSGTRTLGRLAKPAQVVSVSPGGERIALLDDGRYDGRLVVFDRDGVVTTSAALPALTAVGWLAADRLIYATGTVDHPTIAAAPLDALGEARPIYTADRGWFGQLVTGGGRLLFIDSGATFRSRVVVRGPSERDARDLDTGTVGAVLGWLDDGTFLAWNRNTRALERHDLRGVVAATPAHLDGEAANATRAGDVVIASLRRDEGRELVAVSIADGRERWHQPPGHARAVRCAGDRRAPCFVFSDLDDGRLRPIDPETGAEGEPFGPAGRIDDVAVSDDGTQLLISDGTVLRRFEPATGATAAVDAPISGRAIAFDPRGGFLVAGTRSNNEYLVVRVDGAVRETLQQSRNEILFLPRPSPDRDAVLVMGRLFLPAVFELPRPPR